MSVASRIGTRLFETVIRSNRRTREDRGNPGKSLVGASLAPPKCMEYATLLQRVRSEFNEMPGLRLTPAQAARLLGLDNGSCQRVLSTLVSSAFLRWTADGSVIRVES